MSRHNDEHRSCEAITASGGPLRTSEGPLRTSEHESSSLSHNVLSDTDSGVADTEDVAGRSHPTTSRSRNIGARPRTSTHATSQTASTASTSSSNVDLQTLRDPSHYEELNVIGNGKFVIFLFVCAPLTGAVKLYTDIGCTGCAFVHSIFDNFHNEAFKRRKNVENQSKFAWVRAKEALP